MTAAISLLLIAAGAILAFATNVTSSSVDLSAVGWILMVVGVLGLMVWFTVLSSFAPFPMGRERLSQAPPAESRTTYVREAPVERRTVVREVPVERTVIREDPLDPRA